MLTDSKRPLIVIPCLNERTTIGAAVTSALAEVAQVGGTVAVADGGSTDGTLDLLRQLSSDEDRLVIVHNARRVQSAGINLAVQAAGDGHDYLLRVDAHGTFAPGYAAALIDELEARDAGSVVVGMHTVAQKETFQAAVARAQNSAAGTGGAQHRVRRSEGGWVDHGHHAIFRMSAFRAVGGYDETFSHNEDAELDVRLRRAGHRIWMTPEPVYTYYPRRTVGALARQYYRFGQGRARTIVRHREANLRQLAIAPVAPALLGALLVPRSRVARTPVLVWLLAVLAASHATARRASPLEQAQVAVAVGVMHSAWSAGFCSHLLRALTVGLRQRGDCEGTRQ